MVIVTTNQILVRSCTNYWMQVLELMLWLLVDTKNHDHVVLAYYKPKTTANSFSVGMDQLNFSI